MLLTLSSLLEGGGEAAAALIVAAPGRHLQLSAPPRNLLKGSLMPFAGDSQPVASAEKRLVQLNFAPQLLTGDSIASIVSVTVAAYEGIDANAGALVSGSPSFSGAVVSQMCGPGWVAGVTYRIAAQVLTALGETPVVWEHTYCQPVN